MRQIIADKAEILGLLCAEGYYSDAWSAYVVFDKRRCSAYYRCVKRKVVEFSNKNTKLLQRFQDLINNVYGFVPNVSISKKRTPKIVLTRKNVVSDLVSYSNFGLERWVVPETIFNGSNIAKLRFIRGFFDGDGSFSKNCLSLYSSNKDALFDIYKMLCLLKFHSNFRGPYKNEGKKDMYEIYIRSVSRERFIRLVKPIKI
jgi:DNA-binding transcriptional regulator WhiA